MARKNSKSSTGAKAEPFRVRDCALICRTASVHPALNLRELRDRLEICSESSVYHHFCETKLRATFDDPEYSNDFAGWAAHALRDPVLAERLGVINPYDYDDLSLLRRATLDIIDDRLSESAIIPWAPAESQFHFQQAMTVVFDTGMEISEVSQFETAIHAMAQGSIYFHFVEARRRLPTGLDDFSAWLVNQTSDGATIAEELAQIEFHFLSLREIRDRIITALASQTKGR